MLAGHYGLAAAVKSQAPGLPLWALMLSTQLLDVIFVPLYLAGIETAEQIPGRSTYGGLVFRADFDHSLAGAIVIAAIAGLVASRFWGNRGGVLIGAVAFSHWPVDLLVHHADLPVFPGNLGDLPRLGFGLWDYPVVVAALELGLIVAGTVLYYRTARDRTDEASTDHSPMLKRANLATGVMGVVMVLTLAGDIMGIG
jgi:hypothetical protein